MQKPKNKKQKKHHAPGTLRADRRPDPDLASPPDPPHVSSAVSALLIPPRQRIVTPKSYSKFDLKIFPTFSDFLIFLRPKPFQNEAQISSKNNIYLFYCLFGDVFLHCVFGSILHEFWWAWTMIDCDFIMDKQSFSQNWRFQKKS